MQKVFGWGGGADGGGADGGGGGAPAAPAPAPVVTVPANGYRGKHDAVLGHMLEKVEGKPELMIDTVLDFVRRSTDFFADGRRAALALAAVCNRFADVSGTAAADMGAGGGAGAGARMGVGGGAAAVADIDDDDDDDDKKGGAPVARASAAAAPASAPAAEAGVDVPITLKKAPAVALPVSVSKSARAALERFRAAGGGKGAGGGGAGGAASGGSDEIAPGTKCLHRGCDAAYRSEATLREVCVYHPGNPVFHEGFKFWSCCERTKVTDFSEFLSIRGCTEGRHCFRDEAAEAKALECRTDFFQVGSGVMYNIYAKKVDPEQCTFEATRGRLRFKVSFDGGSVFERTIRLAGAVDPSRSKVRREARGARREARGARSLTIRPPFAPNLPLAVRAPRPLRWRSSSRRSRSRSTRRTALLGRASAQPCEPRALPPPAAATGGAAARAQVI